MFSRYAALVKNLRGVVLLNPNEEGALDTVKWLSKRFKYRNLGLTPSSVKALGGRVFRPFRELTYPVKPLEALVASLCRRGMPPEISELLVFASSYASPALLVGSTYVSALEEIKVDEVRVCGNLSVSDWKLHLRIADYTVLDMYDVCVEEALTVLRDPSVLPRITAGRRERVAKDKRRYWRIACESGSPLIIYIDNLSVAAKLGVFEGEIYEDWAAALSVVAVVCIPAGLG
ncbi:MAG: hypothetical protein QXL98_02305 [Thermofilaceae archaeon]